MAGGGQTRGGLLQLSDLGDSLLEAIFSQVDIQTRAGSLPAVCRSFRRLLRGPSACLWPEISFAADISLPSQLDRTENFLAWLHRHGRRCRQLQLDIWNGGLPPQGLQAVRELGEQLEGTLAETLHCCQFLRMRWGGQKLVVGDWVTSARALTCLSLSSHELFVRSPLASVTTLKHLEISTISDAGPELEPRCLPLSITRLSSVPAPGPEPGAHLHLDEGLGLPLPEQLLALPLLKYLDVSESIFGGDHLAAALPRLTHLTSLAFDTCELIGGVPPALSKLAGTLRVLSFDGCSMGMDADNLINLPNLMAPPPHWSVLGCLTRLASLSISNCNLHQLPPAVLTLPRLQFLYLEHNALRCLPPGPYWRLLRVLSTDWEPLLRSHQLLHEAPGLHKLALGSMAIHTHTADGLPPLSSVESLLQSLRSHAALAEILLVVRPAHVHGAVSLVMDAMLQLRGLRAGLEVRPIEHDAFFVEEPEEGEEAEGAAGGQKRQGGTAADGGGE